MKYGEWLSADGKSLRAAALRWSTNHEPQSGRYQTPAMLAFHIAQAAITLWPHDVPITRRDIENIRTDAEFTAQSIFMKELGNA